MLNFSHIIGQVTFPWLSNQSIANTVILVLIAILGRIVVVRMITGRGGVLSDARRKWISVVQNSTILFLILGCIFIWSPQLSTFALSLTAFAVALVVATKEYILCVVGAIYRATSNPFAVGDVIEIQNLRGEVLTEGILTTKLQELGTGSSRFQYSGRILTIPNSVLLTHTVFNEHFRKVHLHHSFKVTVDSAIDPSKIVKDILPRLSPLSKDSDLKAQKSWLKIRDKFQKELPSREPKVALETNDQGKISFVITVFCTPKEASIYETDVTEFILSAVYAAKK